MRNELREIIRGIIVVGTFYLFFTYSSKNIYLFLAIILAGLIIPDILLPRRKKQKASSTKKPSTNSKNYSKKSTLKNTSKKLKNPTNEQLLAAGFNQLEGVDFERLVAMYYEDKGYKPQIIGGSGDHEVDIILTDPKEKYKIAVQCKCWNTKNVDNGTILKLSAGKRVYKCLEAWCITTSDYTRKAKEAAEGSNVRIFNGLYVQETIGKWKQEKLKEKLKMV